MLCYFYVFRGKGNERRSSRKKHSVQVTGERKDSGFELWNDTWVNGKLFPKNREPKVGQERGW